MKRSTLFVWVLVLVLSLLPLGSQARAQGPEVTPTAQVDDLTPPPPQAKQDDSDEQRVPESYLTAPGGPDRFGYTYSDSDGEGCPFDWVEPAGPGALLGADDATTPMPIGFPFPFYGAAYTELSVDSNGALLLQDGASEWANRPLGPDGPTPRLAPFWDDLQVDAVYTQVLGSAPRRILAVTFQARRSGGGPLQFQALLGEDGRVIFQYQSLSGPMSDGQSATIGIQGSAAGLGYLFNGYPRENRLHDGLAVCFQPPAGLYLSPGAQRDHAPAGQAVHYIVSAINQSGTDGTFDFAVDSPWPALVTPQHARVPTGALQELSVTVWVPAGPPGERVDSTVTMTPIAAPESPMQAAARLETARDSGDYGYCGASTTDEAAIFDLQTWTLTTRLSLLPEGDYPYDATMTPDGSEVWIPGASGDGVIVIDTNTNQITHRVAVGEYPVSVAFRQDGAYAFIANRDTEDITVVDTASYAAVGSIPLPTYYLGAGNLALDPSTGLMYVVDWYGDYLFTLDPETMTVTQELFLGTSSSLWQLVASPLGGLLYVTDRGLDVVHVIDTAAFSPITTIPTGDDPWGIDITPDGSLIYVTNEDSHDVTVIDASTNSTVTTIVLPHGSDSAPRDVDFSADGAYAYVTSGSVTGDDEVYVIDTATHLVVGGVNVAPASNPNVVAVAPQMAASVELAAEKQADPTTVILGDPLTYTISYTYTGLITVGGVLVTDTLPVGTAYLDSSGGLTSTYAISTHQVIWDLGSVGPGGNETLTALVLPVEGALAGQVITNEAYLDFTGFANFSATVRATSTVLAPELSIRYPDGSEPPDPLLLCAVDTVTLTAVSNRPEPLAYAWNLGDGTLRDTPTITHNWAFGSYLVSLSTTNAYGWVETDTLAVEVGHVPAAGFLSNSPVELGLNALFTDTSAYSPSSWLWDFGDGVGSSDQPNPVYNYSNPGRYTVTLTVTNRCGVDVYTGAFEVCQSPLANFTSNSPITLGLAAVFTDTTSYGPEAWSWNFGDGVGMSTEPNPVYTYTSPGTYTVTLTVSNTCGTDVHQDMFEVRPVATTTLYYAYLPVVYNNFSAVVPPCDRHTASYALTASATTLQMGDTVTVTATLDNAGCGMLGLPLYSLTLDSGGMGTVLEPAEPAPLLHSLGLSFGQSDSAEFVLQAAQAGQVDLSSYVSFEVHLGYPGPAYWSAASAGGLAIAVTP